MAEAGLQASSVTVGACHVELRGAVPVEQPRDARADDDEANRRSIYGQFGGPALAAVLSDIPAGELQPAIGRTR